MTLSRKLIANTLKLRITHLEVEKHDDNNKGGGREVVESSDWVLEWVNTQILFVIALDMNRQPRLSSSGAILIPIHDRRQSNDRERSICIENSMQWGWHDPMLGFRKRHEISTVACRQVGYDFGSRKDLATSRLPMCLLMDRLEESKKYFVHLGLGQKNTMKMDEIK